MFCHTKSQRLALGAENKHTVTPSSKISHLLAFSLLHPTGPGSASRLRRNHWPLAHKKGPNPWPKGSQLLLSTPLPISAPSHQNPQPQRLGASKRGTEGLGTSSPHTPTQCHSRSQGEDTRGQVPSKGTTTQAAPRHPHCSTVLPLLPVPGAQRPRAQGGTATPSSLLALPGSSSWRTSQSGT